MILLNILVLVFEILYYSMFLYYAKNKGKFKRYLLLFLFISLIGGFIGTNYLYSYMFLIMMIFLGLKYFVKIKVYFRDIFLILFMILLGTIIQFPIYFVGSYFNLISVATIFYQVTKVILVYTFKEKIKKLYSKYVMLWKNNVFYIRFISIVLMYIYIIFSVLFLIIYIIR